MRFKAELIDVKVLVGILDACIKIKPPQASSREDTQSCFLLLSAEKFCISAGTDMSGTNQLHATLSMSQLCLHVGIQSSTNDRIGLVAVTKHLRQAFTGYQTGSSVILRLTMHMNRPALMVHISGQRLDSTHFVPVEVVPARSFSVYQEPVDLPSPTVQFLCPPVTAFRQSIERMFGATRTGGNKTVTLHASGDGRLCVEAHSPLASIKVFYKNLQFRSASDDGESKSNANSRGASGDVDVIESSTLPIQQLASALNWSALPVHTALACMVKQRCVMIFLKLAQDRGTVVQYIPAVVGT